MVSGVLESLMLDGGIVGGATPCTGVLWGPLYAVACTTGHVLHPVLQPVLQAVVQAVVHGL